MFPVVWSLFPLFLTERTETSGAQQPWRMSDEIEVFVCEIKWNIETGRVQGWAGFNQEVRFHSNPQRKHCLPMSFIWFPPMGGHPSMHRGGGSSQKWHVNAKTLAMQESEHISFWDLVNLTKTWPSKDLRLVQDESTSTISNLSCATKDQ